MKPLCLLINSKRIFPGHYYLREFQTVHDKQRIRVFWEQDQHTRLDGSV